MPVKIKATFRETMKRPSITGAEKGGAPKVGPRRNKAARAESVLVGEALKSMRKSLGWSRVGMAQWIGAEDWKIYGWETGKVIVPAHMRKALMHMLGLRKEAA